MSEKNPLAKAEVAFTEALKEASATLSRMNGFRSASETLNSSAERTQAAMESMEKLAALLAEGTSHLSSEGVTAFREELSQGLQSVSKNQTVASKGTNDAVASGFSALSSELAQTTSEHTTSVIEKLEAAVSTLSQALVENGRQASELLTQTSNELSSLLRSRTKLLGWVLFFQLLSIGAAGISIFLSLRP